MSERELEERVERLMALVEEIEERLEKVEHDLGWHLVGDSRERVVK